MDSTRCPDPTQWSRFAVGDLPKPVFASMAEHVQHCAGCATALQELDDVEDPLVSQLRQNGD